MRNSVALASLGLALLPWTGAAAACCIQALVVAVSWILGIDTLGTARWWARIMAPADRLSARLGALALATAAAMSLARDPDRSARPDR